MRCEICRQDLCGICGMRLIAIGVQILRGGQRVAVHPTCLMRLRKRQALQPPPDWLALVYQEKWNRTP